MPRYGDHTPPRPHEVPADDGWGVSEFDDLLGLGSPVRPPLPPSYDAPLNSGLDGPRSWLDDDQYRAPSLPVQERPGPISRFTDRLIDRWESIRAIPDRKERLRRQIAVIALSVLAQVTVLGGGVFAAQELTNSDSVQDPDRTEQTIDGLTGAEQQELSQLRESVIVADEGPGVRASEYKHNDHNHDPNFRAASVGIDIRRYYSTEQPGVVAGDAITGTGGLVEWQGNLYISTIEHVVAGADDPEAYQVDFFAHVPGVGMIRLSQYEEAQHVDFLPNAGNDVAAVNADESVIIPIDPAAARLLELEQKNGTINFLEPSPTPPVEGGTYLVPNPETGENIEFTYVGPNTGMLTGDGGGDPSDPEHPNIIGHDLYLATDFGGMELTESDEPIDDLTISDAYFDALDADIRDTRRMVCQGFSGTNVVDSDNPSQFVGNVSGTVFVAYDEHGAACGYLMDVYPN